MIEMDRLADMLKNDRICLCLLCCLAMIPQAQAQMPACEPFADGDSVCFVGDSITHAGQYVKILRDYYTARYPHRQITFVNSGISGDSLPHVLARFDSDIATNKPTIVYVMMGMNDLRLNRLKAGQPNTIPDTDEAISSYAARLAKLAEKIKALKPRQIVLMSPTMYDQYVMNPKAMPAYIGADQGLALMTQKVQEIAKANGFAFIDLHTPMLDWTHKLQQQNPSMSLVGLDRIHPNVYGHYLMAYQILHAQGQIEHAPNVLTLQADSQGMSQQITPQRWPMTLDPSLVQVPELARLFDTFTTMPCHISGLAAGPYTLQLADAAPVQITITSENTIIDLAFPSSPLSMVSARLFSQSAQIHATIVERLRDPLAARKFLKGEYQNYPDLPKDDIEAAKAILKTGKQGYVANLYRNLVTYGPQDKQQKTQTSITSMRDELYTTAKPIPVTITLKHGKVSAPELSKAIPQSNGSIGYQPVGAAMTDAWFDNRTKNYSDAKELGICGGPANSRTSYLIWRLPSDLQPQQIHKVTLVISEVYASQIDNILLREVLTDWQPQIVNYYLSPQVSDKELCQTQSVDGKWTFSSDQLTACVKQWLSDPADNHGLAVLCKGWRGHGAFSYEENPPVLILE